MKHLFIGGTGRSGTTVTRSVLGNHPEILSLPNEFRINVDPGGLLDLYESLTFNWSPYEADLAIKNFKSLAKSVLGNMFIRRIELKLLSYLGISPRRYSHFGKIIFNNDKYLTDIDELIKKISYSKSKGYWFGTKSFSVNPEIFETKYRPEQWETTRELIRNFVNKIYTNYSAHFGQHAPVFGIDDTPYCILSADRLIKLYPDAFFLHVFRDPRDVVCSYKTMRWGGNDVSIIANRLASVYEKWNAVKQLLDPDSFYELSMESMATNQNLEISKIIDRLSLSSYDDINKVKVSNKAISRYKQELRTNELDIVESILQKPLEQYGYK